MLFRSNDTATTEIYTVSDTLSLLDALPIFERLGVAREPSPSPLFAEGAFAVTDPDGRRVVFGVPLRVSGLQSRLAARLQHFVCASVRVPELLAYYRDVLGAKESDRVLDLHAEIMRVNARGKLDFLHLRGVLVFLGFLVFLGLFVAVFAEIHDPAHRRRGGGCNLHEVHTVLPGEGEGVVEGHDASLFAIGTNDPDFAGTNFPVDPDERSGRKISAWGERAIQDTLVGWSIARKSCINLKYY